jgi:hypothetical protein
MKGVSANIMFGQKPPCGTGFVDILVDETKLPEGLEEDASDSNADINAANVALSQDEDNGQCKMEDVLMEW